MKPALQSFLLLCCLLLSGLGQPYAAPRDGEKMVVAKECSLALDEFSTPQLAQDQAFIFPPPRVFKEASVIAFLDDSEDREEEDETHGKALVGISHAAAHARPRAPGTDCASCAASRTAFCKHFAWSLQERHIVLRVFRV